MIFCLFFPSPYVLRKTSFQIVCCCSLGMLLSPNIIKFEANLHFSLCPPPAVGITVATVKTNLIIIRVMFFGICVHLPANFDGICRPLTLCLAQHISCQSAEPDSVITPGVQLGTRLSREWLDIIHNQSHHRVTAFHSEINLNHVL